MVKVVALISGGIDSAVAAALAMEEGAEIVALHFRLNPFADERGEEKTKKLLEMLAGKFRRKIKLYLVPHGATLAAIAQNCDRKFNCVLCRRMMLRVGEKVAEEEGASALLTGESLGQVASQTLSNLNAEAGTIKIPVARPLLGMDKVEIEALAREFATYEISTLPSACCSIPDKPATKAAREKIEKEEGKLDVAALVENALKGKKAVEIES